jgi:hypothetical protein
MKFRRIKKMKLAIAIALLGATSVSAAPYYVGENLQPKNNVTLGFADTPTKKDTAAARNDTGNIMALELKGSYSPMEKLATRLDLPFYMSSKGATGNSRNALGNIGLGAIWTEPLSASNNAWNYGFTLSADAWAPTSRKAEGDLVANANPTTDLYKYTSKAIGFVPAVGGYLGQDRWSAKTNLGLAYGYFVKSAASRNRKANHMAAQWQLAFSYHILPNLQGNLEYNTIFKDAASNDGTNTKFQHAVTPSISGNYEKVLLSGYATLPLDSQTRNYTNVALGFNAGYLF